MRAKFRKKRGAEPKATHKQRNYLKWLGVKCPAGTTVTQASALISANRPKPPRPPRPFIPTIILRREGEVIKVTSYKKRARPYRDHEDTPST